MRVAVVAEYYPRSDDPVLGIWAHRQALAARDAGAEVSVFVLERIAARSGGKLRLAPRADATRIDGLDVRYVRYLSPPRPWSYAQWGSFAAPPLARALRRAGPFDLIHAHNAVPAGDAALRAGAGAPVVISVHGGDVYWTVSRVPRGARTVARTLAGARIVLANSAGVEQLAQTHGARGTRVVHLGTDLPAGVQRSGQPLIATVAHLVARKRHSEVLRALADIPQLQYLVVGDGPERAPIERLAAELGLSERVELAGQLPHEEALARARTAWAFVMPSVDEAFGVAYIEAMAAGVPAVGCAGEPGPEEIAAAGGGIVLVPPSEVAVLSQSIRELVSDAARRDALGRAARETVKRSFTWPECGRQTVAAYEEALR
jgi:glycosyltransferase involved in cell wall biosynthesis